jgi:ribose-phosphate pyrophosphokinase
VGGKTVAIVDDIIATGGTVIKAAEQLKSQGARKVFAACTHGLFTGGSVPRLEAACDAVFSTDTLERTTTKISAASAIAQALQDISGR